MSLNLRERQIAAIKKMLLLNSQNEGTSNSSQSALGSTASSPLPFSSTSWQAETWKVLVYDRYCRDVISPLLKVGDLRKLGVTLHMLLHSDRQPIPDVPAVYFVLPTEENVKRISQDLGGRLYDSAHLNFAYSISRPLLESLAESALQSDCVSIVSKVYDQYLNFISLEPNLFTLQQQSSYASIRDPTLSEAQIKKNIEVIVNTLFSVLVTLGVVPIIRSSRGNAAEMVASQLDAKLREHLQHAGRNNLFAQTALASTFQRPVLILLDRDLDVPVILQHTWTYQALVHDVLHMALNRVTVEVPPPTPVPTPDGADAKTVKKTYDLDPTDIFWTANTGSPFPNVAEEVEEQLRKYKTDVENVSRSTGASASTIENQASSSASGSGVGGGGGLANGSMDSMNTKSLATAIDSLPELTERKKNIDMHTNILTSLLKQIKERALDSFFALEDAITTRGAVDRAALQSQLAADGKGSLLDKLRLLAIYYLSVDNLSASDMESLEGLLTQTGADVTVLNFIKKEKAFKAFSNRALIESSSANRSMLFDFADKFSGTAMGLLSGVKNLVISDKQLRVTRVVDSIMEMKPDADAAYSYFDPKTSKGVDAGVPRTRNPFKEAIVFIIGGGNYVEYQNLQDYAKKQQPPKKIIYGATEIVTAEDFMNQLSELGKKGNR